MPVAPDPGDAEKRQRAHGRRMRLLLAGSGVLALALAALWLTQARPRVFTLTAKELTVPVHLAPFDNGPLLRRVEAVVRDPVSLSPCQTTFASAPAGSMVAYVAELAPAEPRRAGAPRDRCSLNPHSMDQPVVVSALAPRAIRSLELSTEPSERGAADKSCPIVLRADAASPGIQGLAVSWFAPGAGCAAEAKLLLGQPEQVQLQSLSLEGDPVQGLRSKPPTSLKLPLAQGRPVRLALEDRESITLWDLDQKFSSLSLGLADAQAFSYTVSPVPGPQYTCEAGIAGPVEFTTAAESPLTLSVVRLTRDGLEVSISVPGDFALDTGACQLDSREVRWLSWLLLMLSFLGAGGLCTWLGERVLGK